MPGAYVVPAVLVNAAFVPSFVALGADAKSVAFDAWAREERPGVSGSLDGYLIPVVHVASSCRLVCVVIGVPGLVGQWTGT